MPQQVHVEGRDDECARALAHEHKHLEVALGGGGEERRVRVVRLAHLVEHVRLALSDGHEVDSELGGGGGGGEGGRGGGLALLLRRGRGDVNER